MYHTLILYLLLSYINVFQSVTANPTDVLCGTVAEGACTQQEAKISTCSDGITQYGAGVDDNCYDQYVSTGELICTNALSAAVCPVEGDPCSGCVTMGVPSVQCPDGINWEGPSGCVWQTDGNVLFCGDKLQTCPCTTDDNCFSDQWCRAILNQDNTCNSEKQCVSFAAEGDSCGGKVMPCYLEICAAGMTCLDMDPNIVDEPGVCGEETVSCSIDDDCGSDEWCRIICDATSTTINAYECVPYAIEGENCGGFTPQCNQLKCAPEMSCVDMYPTMMDEPGSCTVLCETDSDCGVDQWCREILNDENTCNTEKQCVSYAAEGESCGGMTCNEEICVTGMTCLDTSTGSICGEEETVPIVPCNTDDECELDEWCRVTCDDDTIKECVPYAVSGESCAGYTLECAFDRCLPEMTCLEKDPSIADLPGVCCEDGYTVTEDGECVELVDEDCEVFGLEPAEVKETICSVCFRERDEISSAITTHRKSKRICKTITKINKRAEISEGTIDEAECMLKFCKTQNKDLNCALEFVVLRDDIKTIDDFISEEDCNCGAFVCDDQPISNAANLGIFIAFGVVFVIFGWM